MKQFVKPITVIAGVIFLGFSLPATATIINHDHHLPTTAKEVKGVVKAFVDEIINSSSFSVVLLQPAAGERIHVTIKNPGKKNLYVSLNGPDGASIDNFFTGKRQEEITKIYNFSIAEQGVYSIEVKYGSEIVKKQIKLEHISIQSVNKLTVQ